MKKKICKLLVNHLNAIIFERHQETPDSQILAEQYAHVEKLLPLLSFYDCHTTVPELPKKTLLHLLVEANVLASEQLINTFLHEEKYKRLVFELFTAAVREKAVALAILISKSQFVQPFYFQIVSNQHHQLETILQANKHLPAEMIENAIKFAASLGHVEIFDRLCDLYQKQQRYGLFITTRHPLLFNQVSKWVAYNDCFILYRDSLYFADHVAQCTVALKTSPDRFNQVKSAFKTHYQLSRMEDQLIFDALINRSQKKLGWIHFFIRAYRTNQFAIALKCLPHIQQDFHLFEHFIEHEQDLPFRSHIMEKLIKALFSQDADHPFILKFSLILLKNYIYQPEENLFQALDFFQNNSLLKPFRIALSNLICKALLNPAEDENALEILLSNAALIKGCASEDLYDESRISHFIKAIVETPFQWLLDYFLTHPYFTKNHTDANGNTALHLAAIADKLQAFIQIKNRNPLLLNVNNKENKQPYNCLPILSFSSRFNRDCLDLYASFYEQRALLKIDFRTVMVQSKWGYINRNAVQVLDTIKGQITRIYQEIENPQEQLYIIHEALVFINEAVNEALRYLKVEKEVDDAEIYHLLGSFVAIWRHYSMPNDYLNQLIVNQMIYARAEESRNLIDTVITDNFVDTISVFISRFSMIISHAASLSIQDFKITVSQNESEFTKNLASITVMPLIFGCMNKALSFSEMPALIDLALSLHQLVFHSGIAADDPVHLLEDTKDSNALLQGFTEKKFTRVLNTMSILVKTLFAYVMEALMSDQNTFSQRFGMYLNLKVMLDKLETVINSCLELKIQKSMLLGRCIMLKTELSDCAATLADLDFVYQIPTEKYNQTIDLLVEDEMLNASLKKVIVQDEVDDFVDLIEKHQTLTLLLEEMKDDMHFHLINCFQYLDFLKAFNLEENGERLRLEFFKLAIKIAIPQTDDMANLNTQLLNLETFKSNLEKRLLDAKITLDEENRKLGLELINICKTEAGKTFLNQFCSRQDLPSEMLSISELEDSLMLNKRFRQLGEKWLQYSFADLHLKKASDYQMLCAENLILCNREVYLRKTGMQGSLEEVKKKIGNLALVYVNYQQKLFQFFKAKWHENNLNNGQNSLKKRIKISKNQIHGFQQDLQDLDIKEFQYILHQKKLQESEALSILESVEKEEEELKNNLTEQGKQIVALKESVRSLNMDAVTAFDLAHQLSSRERELRQSIQEQTACIDSLEKEVKDKLKRKSKCILKPDSAWPELTFFGSPTSQNPYLILEQEKNHIRSIIADQKLMQTFLSKIEIESLNISLYCQEKSAGFSSLRFNLAHIAYRLLETLNISMLNNDETSESATIHYLMINQCLLPMASSFCNIIYTQANTLMHCQQFNAERMEIFKYFSESKTLHIESLLSHLNCLSETFILNKRAFSDSKIGTVACKLSLFKTQEIYLNQLMQELELEINSLTFALNRSRLHYNELIQWRLNLFDYGRWVENQISQDNLYFFQLESAHEGSNLKEEIHQTMMDNHQPQATKFIQFMANIQNMVLNLLNREMQVIEVLSQFLSNNTELVKTLSDKMQLLGEKIAEIALLDFVAEPCPLSNTRQ